MVARQATTWFLVAVVAVALYLCYRIAEPFLNPIFAAIVLAIVFYPLHVRIESFTRRPNLAASISTILVMLIVAVPALVVGIAVTRELGELYQSLNQRSAAQGGLTPYVMHMVEAPLRLLGRYVDLSGLDMRSTLLGWVNQLSRYLVSIGAIAVSNIFSVIFGTVVVFFTLFFLFRDGRTIQQSALNVLPLSADQARRLRTGVSSTIVASMYGGLAVGLAQGSLTGVAFWVLGLASPVVWGLVAAMASLIPVLGTGLVWVPAAALLFMGGHWAKALILLIWGAAIVAQIDAVIRPYIVSGRANLHNLLIFFALLGGVRAFGIMGIFIGPVVISVTITVFDMLRQVNVSSPQIEQSGKRAATASE
jgi:predicted PurR-regulated permease PerM